jgi:cyclic pyranopterin phosphate synthase
MPPVFGKEIQMIVSHQGSAIGPFVGANPPDSLIDGYGRRITYLRLAITDRCNLRCHYCRPETGIPFIPHSEILSLEEYERLVEIFVAMGVNKVRVSGGEPFSRRGCLPFLARLRKINGLKSLHITSNGVKTARFLDELQDLRIDGLNLSLDTLNRERFRRITRRDYLDSVLQTMHGALERGIPLKINSVVLADTDDGEIISLAGLAREFPVTLRFIEKMPFSGAIRTESLESGNLIEERLKGLFPELAECASLLPTTARIFSLPGFQGKLGVIQGYSRQFCATCNKVRVTPLGMLKTCLYDNGVLDLKDLLRRKADDREISAAIAACVRERFANGHEAERFSERASVEPSMGEIGG